MQNTKWRRDVYGVQGGSAGARSYAASHTAEDAALDTLPLASQSEIW